MCSSLALLTFPISLRVERLISSIFVRYRGMQQEPPIQIDAASTSASGKLSLKEIRLVVGEKYPPIITVNEAAELARLAVKTIQKKVSEGEFKQSVKRGKPLRFWRDRFVQEVMG